MDPIPPQGSAELEEPRPIYSGTPSWKVHFSRYAAGATLFVGGVAGVVAGLTTSVGVYVAIIGAVLIVGGVWLLAEGEMRRRATHYRISTRSIDIEQGIFNRRIDTLQLWRVRDVVFEQSFGERMLGLSRVRVITVDKSSPDVLLLGLSDGRSLFERMKSAIESARKGGNVMGIVE